MDFIGNLFAFMVAAAVLTLFISPAWLFLQLVNTTPYYFINLNTFFKRVGNVLTGIPALFILPFWLLYWLCRPNVKVSNHYPVKHKC